MLQLVSILSPIFPLLAGRTKRDHPLWWYALLCIVTEMLLSGTKHLTSFNYKIFPNPFLLLEFLLVSLYFWRAVWNGSRAFFILAAALVVLFVVRVISCGVSNFNMQAAALFYFAYIVYGIAGFYTMMRQSEEVFLEQSSFFWINVGFLIYGSGDFLLFLFKPELETANYRLYIGLWRYMFASINIIRNCCVGIALLYYKPVFREHI